MDKPKNLELKNSLEYSWASGLHLLPLPEKISLPFSRDYAMASPKAGTYKDNTCSQKLPPPYLIASEPLTRLIFQHSLRRKKQSLLRVEIDYLSNKRQDLAIMYQGNKGMDFGGI